MFGGEQYVYVFFLFFVDGGLDVLGEGLVRGGFYLEQVCVFFSEWLFCSLESCMCGSLVSLV